MTGSGGSSGSGGQKKKKRKKKPVEKGRHEIDNNAPQANAPKSREKGDTAQKKTDTSEPVKPKKGLIKKLFGK